jgi:ribonuclease HI
MTTMKKRACEDISDDNRKKAKSAQTQLKDSAVIYFDGGSRGNGSKHAVAGCGFIIADCDEMPVIEGYAYLGNVTNNQAEYTALVRALSYLKSIPGIKYVTIKGDSQLVIRQMTGEYKVRNPGLVPLYTAVKAFVGQFEKVEYVHVRREFNKNADALANKAMNTGISHAEIVFDRPKINANVK